MKIVRRLLDGLVQYKTTEPHELTDKFYKSDGIKAIDIRNTTHEVIEGIELPLDYRNGIFAYNDGAWTVFNQELLDKILADELETLLASQKQNQFFELQKTDWYIIRNVETGVEVPAEILEEREAIREKY